jgi:hypothetical protein
VCGAADAADAADAAETQVWRCWKQYFRHYRDCCCGFCVVAVGLVVDQTSLWNAIEFACTLQQRILNQTPKKNP